jgi:hypothetical protein
MTLQGNLTNQGLPVAPQHSKRAHSRQLQAKQLENNEAKGKRYVWGTFETAIKATDLWERNPVCEGLLLK